MLELEKKQFKIKIFVISSFSLFVTRSGCNSKLV